MMRAVSGDVESPTEVKAFINKVIHALTSPNVEVATRNLAQRVAIVANDDRAGSTDSPVVGGAAAPRQARGPLSAIEVGIGGSCEPHDGGSPARAARVIDAEGDAPARCPRGLTESDAGNLNAVLGHEISRNTMTNYGTQWRNFRGWAQGKGVPALPAVPGQVAAYLAERMEEHGHRPATLRMAAAAIAFVHRSEGLDDPCASPEVKRTLKGATRKAGRSQKQAEALTDEALEAIRSTASNLRPGRGGRLESPEVARSRGELDIALVSLMRDALLRVSEAAALTWKDLMTEPDGTGRLLIRRSKTDAEGEGAVLFVSASTMADLRRIRHGTADPDSVFGLRPNQISKRIKQAAQAAGLGEGFSGHSPRVGMARDLARAGIELPSLMTAGRWRTPAMPAHYVRNETAGRGAVAQFHGHYRRAA